MNDRRRNRSSGKPDAAVSAHDNLDILPSPEQLPCSECGVTGRVVLNGVVLDLALMEPLAKRRMVSSSSGSSGVPTSESRPRRSYNHICPGSDSNRRSGTDRRNLHGKAPFEAARG